LHGYGIATPSPIHYEPDTSWIGSRFMVMPRIVGHTHSDMTYAGRGWLHDAGPQAQRRLHDDFLDTLVALQRVPVTEAPWLQRDQVSVRRANYVGGATISTGPPTATHRSDGPRVRLAGPQSAHRIRPARRQLG
jgi:aminoglycoside phosphotransferase (APT) family kinase protein